jgi:multidrug resistance protein MdtO
MTRYGEYKPPVWNPVEMLRAELTWYPGRTALVGRIVLACTSVMMLAEVFRIPGAVLGASFPILISRESPKAARKSAFQIALACSIATVEVIIGGVLTAGSPFLHVLWVLASLIAAFYVISSLNFVSPALTFSAVIAVAIQVWDYPVPAEVRVDDTLYTLLSILMGCLITALIETLFAKKPSPNAILDGISHRLGLVEALLRQTESAEFPPPALTIQLSRSAAKGVDDLSELLAHSRYEPGFHDLLATVIALTRQLVELGSNLAESAPILSPEDQESCRAIAQNLSSARSCIACKELPNWVDLPLATLTANPVLVEIERTVDLIAQSFSDESLPIHRLLPAANTPPSIGVFVVGALRNKEHFKFAVRGALPALLCYLFHMSTGWMAGLAASILTCTLTARRFTGASRHRQSLRSAGFILGAGVIGLGTEVFILPQIDTLVQYAILFAAVVFVGAWMATSGPRIAFSGFQIVLAYSLVNLNRFTINTSLVPSRDEVLGVITGVVAMWLVFDHLWAENSSTSARNLLLATLRNLADFEAVAAEAPQEANQRLAATSSGINRDFDKLRDLADMYAFESFPKKRQESLVNRNIRTLLPELRAFLFVKTGLLQHINLAAAEPDALVREVQEQASSVLRGLANAIEREAPEQLSLRNKDAEGLRTRVFIEGEKSRDGNDRRKHIEMRLCASVLEIASHLEWRVRLNCALETGVEEAVGDWPIGKIAETGETGSRVN